MAQQLSSKTVLLENIGHTRIMPVFHSKLKIKENCQIWRADQGGDTQDKVDL
jgi:hypothetical protein